MAPVEGISSLKGPAGRVAATMREVPHPLWSEYREEVS